MAKRNANPADFIVPLDMNGLAGRMMHVPAPRHKDAEILFIYGQHSSLERWWGLIQYLNRFGSVTVPDLPGFGDMESFYKIGKKPTIDNLADYLAAFIKMRYKRKKVTIVGLSFGFVVVTRTLQRYPKLTKNCQLVVSLSGFTHSDDFIFTKRRHLFYRIITKIISYRVPAFIFRYACLNEAVLRRIYHHTYLAKSKFNKDSTFEDHKQKMDVEIWLWQHNDLRTHALTTFEFLKFDNCRVQVDLPVWQIMSTVDQYFNHHRVEQHLHVVFSKVNVVESKLLNHAPSVIADEKAAALLVPNKLRDALNKL